MTKEMRRQELEGMNRTQHRELCKAYGIKGYANFTRAQYIERILEAETFEEVQPEADIFDELTKVIPEMSINITQKKTRGESIFQVLGGFINFYQAQYNEITEEVDKMKATNNKPNDTTGTFEQVLSRYEAKQAHYVEIIEALKEFGVEKLGMTFPEEVQPEQPEEVQPAQNTVTEGTDYTKEVSEYTIDKGIVKVETFRGANWTYIRETLNNQFRKAAFSVNAEIIKVKVPSKKNIEKELQARLNITVKLK